MDVNNQTIGSCQKAHTIIKHANQKYSNTDIDPYILFVTLWSDDFEVNHTRKNCNSTWIKTIIHLMLIQTYLHQNITVILFV